MSVHILLLHKLIVYNHQELEQGCVIKTQENYNPTPSFFLTKDLDTKTTKVLCLASRYFMCGPSSFKMVQLNGKARGEHASSMALPITTIER